MTSAAGVIVTLRGVGREYAGGVTALRDVDLDIHRGELVAIVGPSGSGKTTMLNMMGTLDRPSSGQVVIDGFDVAELSDRELSALRARQIGFVFQHFHLAPGVSVLDNVSDGLGGERQRTAIARAVVGEPALLLADEPTGALDSQSGEGVMRLLLDLNNFGTTVVVITHEPAVASHLARHVSMLDGHVVGDQTVAMT